jgi:hypothetical protein
MFGCVQKGTRSDFFFAPLKNYDFLSTYRWLLYRPECPQTLQDCFRRLPDTFDEQAMLSEPDERLERSGAN